MFDENVARADRYPVELTHRVTLVPASAHHTGPGPDPACSTDGALVVAKHQRALNEVRERQVLILAKHCLKEREYTLRRGRVRSGRKHDLGHLAPCWNLSPFLAPERKNTLCVELNIVVVEGGGVAGRELVSIQLHLESGRAAGDSRNGRAQLIDKAVRPHARAREREWRASSAQSPAASLRDLHAAWRYRRSVQ